MYKNVVTKEALARKKAEGVYIGRIKGSHNRPETYVLYGKEEQILEWLKQGVFKVEIARRLGVDVRKWDFLLLTYFAKSFTLSVSIP